MNAIPFPDLPAIAIKLREDLQNKKFVLLYAYNGTGKTRLSAEFNKLGKVFDAEGEATQRDTLYFNAFTEDLFTWENDLEGDNHRYLKLNVNSRFFQGLASLEMDNRIRPLMNRYIDFDFRIDFETNDENILTKAEVVFFRGASPSEAGEAATDDIPGIKISRGEENLFIWCFFLAVVQLVLDDDGSGPYGWVKFIYIDDPISSLDEQNAIAVASQLAQMLKREDSMIKTVISTHHTLFFNVLCNTFNKPIMYFLAKEWIAPGYLLRDTSDTPFFHHVANLAELYKAEREGIIYTHHFNMLRAIMEKTTSFLGYKNFSSCIRQGEDDPDGVVHTRLVNLLSHGNYSLYEPREMLPENKEYFRTILHNFVERYPFNPELLAAATTAPDSANTSEAPTP